MAFGNEKCKDVVENICPHCGELLLMNKRSFANHVRWCKSNPKYNEIRKRTIEKISKSLKREENEIKEFTFNCVVCNNLYGVSRDHIFSQDDGLKYLIDPYIISHPANCRLLQHSKNASKHNKSDITIDDLILKIHQWHAKYGVYENKIDYTYFDTTNIELKYRKIFENN